MPLRSGWYIFIYPGIVSDVGHQSKLKEAGKPSKTPQHSAFSWIRSKTKPPWRYVSDSLKRSEGIGVQQSRRSPTLVPQCYRASAMPLPSTCPEARAWRTRMISSMSFSLTILLAKQRRFSLQLCLDKIASRMECRMEEQLEGCEPYYHIIVYTYPPK